MLTESVKFNISLEKIKQKYVLTLALIFGSLAFPYFFVFNYINAYNAAMLVLVLIPIYIFSGFMNRYYLFSGMLLITSTSISILYFASVLGRGCGAQLILVGTIVSCFMLYGSKHKFYLLLTLTTVILCALILEISNYSLFVEQSNAIRYQNIIYFCATVTTFVQIITSLYFYLLFTNQYEREINSTLEELEFSNNKLKESRKVQIELTQQSEYAKLVQSIAHEFKNPLQMLQGTAEIGLEKEITIEKSKVLFKTVISTISRLNNLIQPLLQYLKTDRQYNFVSFDINNLINDIQTLSIANCRAKKIQLLVKLNNSRQFVLGDKQYLGQSIINLITNAIESINISGKIDIILNDDTFSNQNNQIVECVRIDVIDNGCGVDEEHLKTIFTPYQSKKLSKKNVGLGLSIVSKIIKDHDGLIKIKSKKDVGTTVSIWLTSSTEVPKATGSIQSEYFELEDSFFE